MKKEKIKTCKSLGKDIVLREVEDKLENFIEYLQSLYNQYTKAGYSDLEINFTYCENPPDMFISGYKLETDEEFNKRMIEEKREQERKYKLYLDLKKEFENK